MIEGSADGETDFFIRPREMTIRRDPDAVALRGAIRRVHDLGAARRVEIALAKDTSEHLIEVDAPRDQTIAKGQAVGFLPKPYRIFEKAR